MRLANKIGIVTAAASGMGRAGAIRFAAEGASVAVVDLNKDATDAVVRQITDAGGKAIGLSGDLTSDEFARDIVRQTARHFGGLDFVWNHVGTPGPASIEGLDWKDYDFAMNLNVRSVLVTTEAALPELRARGGGSILFTASTSGLQGSQFSPVYNIAKFGVVGLVKGLAKRYGRENIRINAVCPGPIDTPMLRVFVARPDSQMPPGEDPESLVIKRGGQTPMGRPGQPHEIANAALFLLSDEASFVNGAALPVDGGATA
jgi:NAD(P)-dependent dehydrogenase (short-subunit alcohol dehydrogenase family)